MKDEKEFLKQAVEAGKPIFGICLGAQMLTDILDARVYENRYVEMGLFPVKAEAQERVLDFLEGLPEEITFFHWYSQTFNLPAGTVHIFESEECKNQGFITATGLYHFNSIPSVDERIHSLIIRVGDGMGDEPFVKKREKILEQRKFLTGTKEFMFLILCKT